MDFSKEARTAVGPNGWQRYVDKAAEYISSDPNASNTEENRKSVAVALSFLESASPKFLASDIARDDDRLLKAGRSIQDLVAAASLDGKEEMQLRAGLTLLVEELEILASGKIKVPRVRFGKTELQMPLVTLGSMRYQQSWNRGNGPHVDNMDQVNKDVQENLAKTIKYAVTKLGMVHIETARNYGSSELQIGAALKSLVATGEVKREDLIVQTKLRCQGSAAEFRKGLETCFSKLQLDYVDLFAFHGINWDFQLDYVFGRGREGGNCWDVVQEYVRAGKIRHVGFSTHGAAHVIRKAIETDKFDYVNLHFHYFDSYTATGDGPAGGNADNMRLLKEKNMGVFIISPYDKGGRLYAPSRKLRSLTLPEMEPITFGSQWLWSQDRLTSGTAPVHTIVCGAARPSDLDQPAIAAYKFGKYPEETARSVDTVASRLDGALAGVFDEAWSRTWHVGLVNGRESKDGVQFGQIVGLYNLIQAFGLVNYARDRYENFDNNKAHWDPTKSAMDNMKARGLGLWGVMPGVAITPGTDYVTNRTTELTDIPTENKERVKHALEFTHHWCSKTVDRSAETDLEEWKTAYDMRPWTAYCERL